MTDDTAGPDPSGPAGGPGTAARAARRRRAPAAATTRPPIPLVVPAVVALLFLLLPLLGVLVRTPWADLLTKLATPGVLTAFVLSLECSFGALAASLVIGVPLAWLLARTHFPGKALVRALVTLPLVLPPVAGGVALLLAFGTRGIAGGVLGALGIVLPFSKAGAIVAETFVALPFLVLSVEGALAGLDRLHEEVAATLGARPVRVFFTVTLPLVAPAVAAGAALSWARALGEFGATITFAGNFEGTTQTLPLAVYVTLQSDPEAAVALSLVLLALSLAVLVLLRGSWLGSAGGGGRDGRGRRRARRFVA